jgi:hypothetical protein
MQIETSAASLQLEHTPTSQAVGAAGELIAQARLLMREWIVGNVNSGGMMNAPAVDLLAAKGNRMISIAVKCTGRGGTSVQWSRKPGAWTSLFKGDTRPEFVVFVWFTSRSAPDACRIFVVPAPLVDEDVCAAHTHWHAHTKRDGSARRDTGHVAIKWDGSPTEGNISSGFAVKWREYEDAWHLLDQET